jgi:hypothetical protein
LGGPGYGENTFIGLDVHAVNVVGCALDPATGELMRTTMAADPAAGLDWIRRFEAPVKAVYESGPTGYALTRFLSKTGIDCLVTASPMLLRAPGRQSQDGQAGRHCAGRHARSLGTVPRSGWRALPKKIYGTCLRCGQRQQKTWPPLTLRCFSSPMRPISSRPNCSHYSAIASTNAWRLPSPLQ